MVEKIVLAVAVVSTLSVSMTGGADTKDGLHRTKREDGVKIDSATQSLYLIHADLWVQILLPTSMGLLLLVLFCVIHHRKKMAKRRSQQIQQQQQQQQQRRTQQRHPRRQQQPQQQQPQQQRCTTVRATGHACGAPRFIMVSGVQSCSVQPPRVTCQLEAFSNGTTTSYCIQERCPGAMTNALWARSCQPHIITDHIVDDQNPPPYHEAIKMEVFKSTPKYSVQESGDLADTTEAGECPDIPINIESPEEHLYSNWPSLSRCSAEMLPE